MCTSMRVLISGEEIHQRRKLSAFWLSTEQNMRNGVIVQSLEHSSDDRSENEMSANEELDMFDDELELDL